MLEPLKTERKQLYLTHSWCWYSERKFAPFSNLASPSKLLCQISFCEVEKANNPAEQQLYYLINRHNEKNRVSLIMG